MDTRSVPEELEVEQMLEAELQEFYQECAALEQRIASFFNLALTVSLNFLG